MSKEGVTMTKEEFCNIIVKKIEEYNDILNKEPKYIEFLVRSGQLNAAEYEEKKRLARQKIEFLKSLILAPVYEKISNATHEEIEQYKLELIERINVEINNIDEEIADNEKVYAVTEEKLKVLTDSVLTDKYDLSRSNYFIDEGTQLGNKIENTKIAIDKQKKQREEKLAEIERIKALDDTSVKQELIWKLKLNELNGKYLSLNLDYCEKIVAYLLDKPEVEEKLRNLIRKYKYEHDRYTSVKIDMKSFKVENYTSPSVNNNFADYIIRKIFESYSYLEESYDSICEIDKKTEMVNTKKVEFIKIGKELEDHKTIVSKFAEVSNINYMDVSIDDLNFLNKQINGIDSSFSYEIEKINEEKAELERLNKSFFKTRSKRSEILSKQERIQRMISNILNKMWKKLCAKMLEYDKKMFSSLSNGTFNNSLYYDIKEKFNSNNVRSLMTLINEWISNINVISKKIDEYKDRLVSAREELSNKVDLKNTNLGSITSEIQNITQNVSPNFVVDYAAICSLEQSLDTKKDKVAIRTEAQEAVSLAREEAPNQELTIDELEKMREKLLKYVQTLDVSGSSKYTI